MTEIEQISEILKKMDPAEQTKIRNTINMLTAEMNTELQQVKVDLEYANNQMDDIHNRHLNALPDNFRTMSLKDIDNMAVMNDDRQDEGYARNWLALQIKKKTFNSNQTASKLPKNSIQSTHSQSALKNLTLTKNFNKENSQHSLMDSGYKGSLNSFHKPQTPSKTVFNKSHIPIVKHKPPRILKKDEGVHSVLFLSQDGSPLLVNEKNNFNLFKKFNKITSPKSIKQH